jgi:myosin heavy subunit
MIIDTFGIYEAIASTLDDKTAKTLTGILTHIYTDIQQMATRQDFNELKAAVSELVEAQKRSEGRIDRLEQAIIELTEAQRHTEQRLAELTEAQKRSEGRIDRLEQAIIELTEAQRQTEQKLAELTEAQRQTEQKLAELTEAQKRSEGRIDRLEQAIIELTEAQRQTEQKLAELTEAQRHTDQKLAELTEAQRHTEQKLAELTEAQRQTEQNLSALIKRVDIIEERLEGISDSVGYSLENNAYRALPKLLANRGIHVKQRLKRCYINGYQVNIFGTAQRDGKDILIFGECKTRPSKKEIDRFVRITDKLCQTKGCEDRILLVVAHDLHPTVEKYLLDKDIMYFWSYELDSD